MDSFSCGQTLHAHTAKSEVAPTVQGEAAQKGREEANCFGVPNFLPFPLFPVLMQEQYYEGKTTLQGGAAGFDTGNTEKLSSTQATLAWVLLSFSPISGVKYCGPTI